MISYGAQADAVVTTARRDANADASDQVLVVFEKKNYSLEITGGWDTLGMRGTCSSGFALKAIGAPEQIMPVPYGEDSQRNHGAHLASDVGGQLGRHRRRRGGAGAQIHAQGASVPARCRRACRISPKSLAKLRSLRALIAASLNRYESIAQDPKALSLGGFPDRDQSSEGGRFGTGGGNRDGGDARHGPFRLSQRHRGFASAAALRDVLSSPIMINNDRILANLSASTLLSEIPSSIRD